MAVACTFQLPLQSMALREHGFKFDGVFKTEKNLPCFSPATEREQVHMHLGYISIFTHSVHMVE